MKSAAAASIEAARLQAMEILVRFVAISQIPCVVIRVPVRLGAPPTSIALPGVQSTYGARPLSMIFGAEGW
jgi:hypothetical protein